MPEGEVYVTGNFLDANDLKEGDKLTITHGKNSVEFTIAGKAKDALLGSEFMGNKRFILNEAVSILENAGLMGVKIPEVLRSRIDVLRKEEQSK